MNDLINIAMDMCVVGKRYLNDSTIVERTAFESLYPTTPQYKSGYKCMYPEGVFSYDITKDSVTYHRRDFYKCDIDDSDFSDVWQLEKQPGWDPSQPLQKLGLKHIDCFHNCISGRNMSDGFYDTGVYVVFRTAYKASKRVVKTMPVTSKVGLVWNDSNDFHYAIAASMGPNKWKVLTDNPSLQQTGDINTIAGYPTEQVTEYHWVKL